MPDKFLGLGEDLEDLRARVERLSGRPTFVVAACARYEEDCRYRRPGDTQYELIGPLELFMSRWVPGPCIGWFDAHGTLSQRTHWQQEIFRRFDLHVAPWARLVYPLLPTDDARRSTGSPAMRSVGLDVDWNTFGDDITPSPTETIPPVLQPYLADYPNDYPREHVRHKVLRGIRFAISEYVEFPEMARPDWHEGVPYGLRLGVATSLQPPGQYSGHDITNLYAMNTWCLLDCEPGPCIACHGKSGQRRHVSANRGKEFPMGAICQACFPRFAEQVQALLAAWQPPNDPEKDA